MADMVNNNLTFKLRQIAKEHIRNTQHIDEYNKPLVQDIVISQINIIGQYLGTIELTTARVKACMREEP